MDFPCTQRLADDLNDTFVDEDEGDQPTEKRRIAFLVVKESSHQGLIGKSFSIFEGDNIIGRHENCDVSIPEGVALSKKHACIEADPSLSFVYDCGSINKTRLKKFKLKPEVRYALADGDELQFANIKCMYKQIEVKEENEEPSEKTSPFEKVEATPAVCHTSRVLVADTPASALGDRKDIDKSFCEYPEIVPDSQPCNDQSTTTADLANTDGAVIDESICEPMTGQKVSSKEHSPPPSQEALVQSATRKKLIIESDSDSTDIDEKDSIEISKGKEESNHYDSETDVEDSSPPAIDPYDEETDIEDDEDQKQEETTTQKEDKNKDTEAEHVADSDATDVDNSMNDSFSMLQTQVYHDNNKDSRSKPSEANGPCVDDSFAELETQGFFQDNKILSGSSVINDACRTSKDNEAMCSTMDDSFAAIETQAYVEKSANEDPDKSIVEDSEIDESFASLETQGFLPKPTNILNIPQECNPTINDSMCEMETQAYVVSSEKAPPVKPKNDGLFEGDQSDDNDFEDSLLSGMQTQSFCAAKTTENSIENVTKTAETEEELPSSHEFFASSCDSLEDTVVCEDTEPIVPTQCTTSTSAASDAIDMPEFANSLASFPGDTVPVIGDSQSFVVSLKSQNIDMLEDTQPVADDKVSEDLLSLDKETQRTQKSIEECDGKAGDGKPLALSPEKTEITEGKTLIEVDGINTGLDKSESAALNVDKNQHKFVFISSIPETSSVCAEEKHSETDVEEAVEEKNAMAAVDISTVDKSDTKSCQVDATEATADELMTQICKVPSLAGKGKENCAHLPSNVLNHSQSIYKVATVEVRTPEKNLLRNSDSFNSTSKNCLFQNRKPTILAVKEELSEVDLDNSETQIYAATSLPQDDEDFMQTQVYSEPKNNLKSADSYASKSPDETGAKQDKHIQDVSDNDKAPVVTRTRQSGRLRKANKRFTENNAEPSPLSRRTRSKKKAVAVGSQTNTRRKAATCGKHSDSSTSSLRNASQKLYMPMDNVEEGITETSRTQFLKMEFEPITVKHELHENTQDNTQPATAEEQLQLQSEKIETVDSQLQATSSCETQFLKMEFQPVTVKCDPKTESDIGTSTKIEEEVQKQKDESVDDGNTSSNANESQFLKMEFAPVTVDCEPKRGRNKRASKRKGKPVIEQKDTKTTNEGETSNSDTQFLKMEFNPVVVKCNSPSTDDSAENSSKTRHLRKRRNVGNASASVSNTNASQSPAKKVKSECEEVDLARKAALSLRPRKTKPKIVFTGVVDKVGESIIRTLGGTLTDDMHECTHLVTDKIRRTVKFLCAVVRGVHIVSPSWLRDSEKCGRFVTEEGFQLNFDPNQTSDNSPTLDLESQYGFNLSASLHLSRTRKNPIFSGLCFHVMKSVLPPPEQMHQILECGGAEILQKLPRFRDEEKWKKLVIIATEQDKSACLSTIKRGARVVGNEFILTGVLRQKLEFQRFQLFASIAPPSEPETETKMTTRGQSSASQAKSRRRRK